MPGIARVHQDVAGDLIVGVLAPTVFANGMNVAVLGAQVRGHGDAPHSAPVMSQSSSAVFANGIGICRAGDAASCGHATSGSSNVFCD